MGFLDDLKDKAEDFGDKAKEGIDAARDKASDLVGDVKDRFDGDNEAPAAESAEPGIDYSPTAVDEAAAGGISEAAAGAGGEGANATESPVDTIGDVPEPDLSEAVPPTVGEVPEAGLGDLSAAPGDDLPLVDDGTGELGENKDEFGPA
ncbi:MAG TPA: hypothetical protein VLJ88_08310 [Propionibacteriaceae bacterium]|nr:hypothetical protein [Propionibacteriaceae bacterium]